MNKEIEEILIMKLLGLGVSAENDTNVSAEKHSMVGKVCIIRTYSAGVHYGLVAVSEGKRVVLKDARRIHYWVNACSLSQIAKDGITTGLSECRISVPVNEIELTEAVEIIPMTNDAIESLSTTEWSTKDGVTEIRAK